MNNPQLIIFSISHYCEKARWVLDHLNLSYQLKIVAPGPHALLAKQLGAASSSLPILVIGDDMVQGSSNIIDWAESATDRSDQPIGRHSFAVAPEHQGQAQAIEARLDRIAGVHLRRMFYSEALVELPNTVKPVFMEGLSFVERCKLSLIWPKVRSSMIKRMDLGYEQGLESRDFIVSELDWLDSLLIDGREFLVGERFSRVDITAASLLARLVSPPNHPGEGRFVLPPRAKADALDWAAKPSLKWVVKMYDEYR